MAPQPGNYYTFAFGKQTAKGTPQTTPKHKTRITGGFIRPDRQIVDLAETDSSRQAPPSVVVGSRAGGTMSHYARSDEYAFFAAVAQGASTPTGAGPYTHAAVMTTLPMYVTGYEAYGSTVLVNRFADLVCTRHVLRGEVGGIFTVENTWAGVSSLFGETDPVLAPSTVTPLTWPKCTVTKGGVTTDLISTVELVLDNGGEYVEGDVGLEPFDYLWGRQDISGQITMLFQDDDEYREFHGGSAAATTPSETIFEEALTVTISRGASDEISWVMSAVQYRTFDIQPDPGGTAIRVPMAFRAKAQTLPANTLTINTKNALATAV